MRITYQHFRINKKTGQIARWFKSSRLNGEVYRPPFIPSERGGATVCILEADNGEIASWGLAECSQKDAFCYATGRSIAKGRAFSTLNGEKTGFSLSENSPALPVFNSMQKKMKIYDTPAWLGESNA